MKKIKKKQGYYLIVGIYVFTIVAIFPLVFHDYYYDMPAFKYKFYYIVSLIFFSSMAVYALIYLCKEKVSLPDFKIHWAAMLRWSVTDTCLLFFLLAVLISTLLSPYRFEAFWGNEGRYSGFFLILIYGFAFFLVSKFFDFKAWYLDAFIITGILVCLFGITDFFNLDLLGFKAYINLDQRDMFTSTLGNVNFYSAYVAMVMGVAVTMFTAAAGPRVWLYYLAMSITFIALITGRSDNAILSTSALFVLLPFYIFKTKKGICRYLISVSTLFSIMQVIVLISINIGEQVSSVQTAFLSIASIKAFPYMVMAMWIFTLLVVIMRKKSSNDGTPLWLRQVWFALILIAMLLLIWIIWDINRNEYDSKYGMLSQFFLLNDEWGTNRGYIWRIALESYQRFPLPQKIFGYGMDTFGIITKHNYFAEMLSKYGECFDSAHNEYLQYFVTIGPVGLVSYLVFLESTITRLAKKAVQNPCIMAILFSVLCYCTQAFVNISTPNIAPIMWTLLMIGMAACNASNRKGVL